MLRTAIRTSAALALLMTTLGIILAQAPNPPLKSSPHTALRAKSILGAKVHLQGGTGAGTVEDIVFDEEGVIDYFVVSEGGKLVTVPWEAAKLNFETRVATINITPEQFRQIPTYSPEKYPEFYTPTYQTQVYKYYGLTPGKERRFERRMQRK